MKPLNSADARKSRKRLLSPSPEKPTFQSASNVRFLPKADNPDFAVLQRPICDPSRLVSTDAICTKPTKPTHPSTIARVRVGSLRLLRFARRPSRARAWHCQLCQLRASGYPRAPVTAVTLEGTLRAAILIAKHTPFEGHQR